MAKLYVPGPEEVEEPLDPLFLSGVVCLLLALAILVWFSRFQPRYVAAEASVEANVDADPFRAQRAEAARIALLTEEEVRSRPWTDAELEAVARFGPRSAAESACEARSADSLASVRLAPILEERSPHAPWTCLTRRLVARQLVEGPIRRQVEAYWEELRAFAGDVAIVTSVLEQMRAGGAWPDDERFWAWVRICAIHPDYEGARACQRLLERVSPQQGADLLLMVDRHLERSEAAEADLPIITAGLGQLARHGQPQQWRVVETAALPDYDVDLRLGAIFMLCRFVHAPDERVATTAARQLAQTARVGGRGLEEKLLPRWRETCRLAFGGGKARDPHAPAPLLAVWSGEEGVAPDYTLAGAIARGDCERRAGHPAWWCGASAWPADGTAIDITLADLFVHTRYMEWEDDPL